MSTTLSCVAKVRSTCLTYAKTNPYVTIHASALRAVADQIRTTSKIQWDEESWHYQPPQVYTKKERQERLALYILALDAINFCFWPTENYEYEDLSTTLTRVASADHPEENASKQQTDNDDSNTSTSYLLSAVHLRDMTPDRMKQLFEMHSTRGLAPPDVERRCKLWNQVGTVLMETFNGSASALIQSANNSAVALVELLIKHFSGFCDYNEKENLWFLKRAQICVADWNAALQLQLSEMNQLTTFADYRVPQLLRHLRVLDYSEELGTIIDLKQEVPAESTMEWSIRACTVAAVEMIVDELRQQQTSEAASTNTNRTFTAVDVDWYLWQIGERMQMQGELEPHHRTRTIYY